MINKNQTVETAGRSESDVQTEVKCSDPRPKHFIEKNNAKNQNTKKQNIKKLHSKRHMNDIKNIAQLYTEKSQYMSIKSYYVYTVA